MRGIQYAVASRINRELRWNTGSPAIAGDDDLKTVIASQRVGAKRRPMTGSAKQSIFVTQ
jgi:hypothetical protein